MKKILYIWKGPYPFEIRIKKICESLADFGFDVTILCKWNREALETETINNVKIIRAGYNKNTKLLAPFPYNRFWFNEIEKIIDRIKPNLIFNREFFLATETSKAARKRNIPVIMDMAEHYPAALRTFEKYNKPIFKLLFHKLKLPDAYEKHAVKLMDGVIVVCDEQKTRLSDELFYPSNKIEVVQNTPFKLVKSFSKPNPNNEITLCHHGYLTGDKAIHEFLKGFLLACDTNTKLKFVVAGFGECLSAYKDIVNKSKHNSKVVFTGEYNYDDLENIIRNSTAGVVPFRITDFNNYTIHNKIFDYFSYSKPVIVSECNPLKRIINETNAGYCSSCESPDDAKKSILEFADMDLAKFSKNAYRAYTEKYNWGMDSIKLLDFVRKYL